MDLLKFITENSRAIITLLSSSLVGLIFKQVVSSYNKRVKYKQKKVREYETVQGGGIIIDTLYGYVSAPGFDPMSADFELLESISWTFQIKIVNPNKFAVCITGVDSEFIGHNGYGATLYCKDLYRIKRPVVKAPSIKNQADLPLLVYPESEIMLYVKVGLQTYKKLFFFKRPTGFTRSDIDVTLYEKIRKKQKIVVKTDKGSATQWT